MPQRCASTLSRAIGQKGDHKGVVGKNLIHHISVLGFEVAKLNADPPVTQVTLTLVSMESATQTVAFGGRPGPLRTPPEASQAAKLGPHGPLGMAKTDIYFSHQ